MGTSAEAGQSKFVLNSRQKKLLPLVMFASFFEGFDFMVINLSLPYISKDLGISTQLVGVVLSIVAIGAVIAFFIVRLADKYGRRPMFLLSVLSYSLLSIITAFTHDVHIFTVCQFLARVFLITCLNVGFVIIAEEFKPEIRGRAIGLFSSASSVGCILPAVCLPLFISSPLSWRGLFLLGGLPLFAVLFFSQRLPETEAFLNSKKDAHKTEKAKPSVFSVFQKPYRASIVKVMGMWFGLFLVNASIMSFFSFRVVTELGWTPSRVGTIAFIGAMCSLGGFYLVGKALDRFGRKKTASVSFICGTIFNFICFQATNDIVVSAGYISAQFFIASFSVLVATISNELFPSAIRANANAWANNMVGRTAAVLVPVLATSIASSLGGIGNAVTLVATTGGIICAIIAVFFIPETLGFKIPEYEETPQKATIL